MQNKINHFIKITEGEKVALIDPQGKVCLGVSKRLADNLDKKEVRDKLYPIWKSQTEFIKQIDAEHERINTAYLMVTRTCNMDCDFCAINANNKVCSEKEFKLIDIKNSVVPFLQKVKPHKLIITGGEPLIKQQIVEIAKTLKKGLSCFITLQSNGLAITQQLVEELKGYIDEIDFSTKHMFCTEEREKQLIENIEICQNAGIEVLLTFIYEKDNENDMFKMMDIAAKYDTNVLFSVVSAVGRAKEKSKILTDVDHLDMNLKIAKYISCHGYEKKKMSQGLHQRIQVRKSCGGYGKVMAIFPEGDIYMCQCMEKEQVKMGNILTHSADTVFNNLEELLSQNEIKKLFCVDYKEICKECDYRYICGGKCAATEETYDYNCIFVKTMLKYILFYHNAELDEKQQLENYIKYLEKVFIKESERE